MRSIVDFIRRALASAARFVFVFVRGVGEEVGHWIRVLQPAQAAPEPEQPRTIDEMLPQPPRKPGTQADISYEAVRQVAEALAADRDPTPAQMAAIADPDIRTWLGLLNSSELRLVAKLSPGTLRQHLTGRFRAQGLLRLATAEMINREHELGRRREGDDPEPGLVLAS